MRSGSSGGSVELFTAAEAVLVMLGVFILGYLLGWLVPQLIEAFRR